MSKFAYDYDVVIAGAGPAGASAAIHLASRGARVALAEQKKFPRAKLCGEFISPECLDHFEKLGVAGLINEAGGASLTETVFYSRRGSNVAVPSAWFGARSSAALGLSRAEMDARLLLRAREAGALVLEGAQAAGLIVENETVRGVHLKMESGAVRDLRALVTIDATGRGCALARRTTGARTTPTMTSAREITSAHERDATRVVKGRAPLVAFKAHLEGARVAPGRCEIYIYRGGYGGLSSVERGLSNLCFIVRAEDVRACASDAERVMREVVCQNARAKRTLEGARAVSPWLSVALEGFGRRKVVPARGLLAIGDAASFIDPFTGSGMLMALESGAICADVLTKHLGALRESLCDDAFQSFRHLADDYRALYAERFDGRLRVCSFLRRAAFVPGLAEAMIRLTSASARLRRSLTSATRGRRGPKAHEASEIEEGSLGTL